MVRTRATLAQPGRLFLVRLVEEGGWPAAQVAEAAGVSWATGYKSVPNRTPAGSAGRSSRPKRTARPLPAEQIARILKLRRGLRRGPHRLAAGPPVDDHLCHAAPSWLRSAA